MNGGTLDSLGDIVTMDTWERNKPKCRGLETRPVSGCLGRAEPVAQPATPKVVAGFALGKGIRR